MPKIVAEGAQRIHTMSFKVSQAEKDQIAYKASSRGISPAAYMRAQAMQNELPPVVAMPAVNHELIVSLDTLKGNLDNACTQSIQLLEKTAKGRNKNIPKEDALAHLDWFAKCTVFFKTAVAEQILMLEQHNQNSTVQHGLPKL